jgi:phosphatidylethanolamine/phosphatidyl-N-methylethanolamine N-methyltransferase
VNHESDRQYWERHAKGYDASLRLLGRPFPRMLELVTAELSGCGRVLEVASGTGLVTLAIATSGARVIATDYAETMVAILEKRVRDAGLSNVTCERADLSALRFQSGAFDAVVAANVLHLVPDLDAALASLRRVLRPGGRLVVPTFCHDETKLSWLISRALAITGFPAQRRFTTRSLYANLRDRGLELVTTERLHGVIPIGYAAGTFRSDTSR